MDDAAEKDHDFSQCLWEGKSKGTLTDEEQERFNDFKTKNFEVVSAEDSDTYDFTVFWIVCWEKGECWVEMLGSKRWEGFACLLMDAASSRAKSLVDGAELDDEEMQS